MRGCNAQTNGRRLVPVLPLRTPRGLELIKSSAKFYANGAGTAKPTVQLSYLVHSASNNPAAERTSPAGKLSVRAIATFCLLLLVLPGLALAAIVWCGTRIVDSGAPEIVAGRASPSSARLASSVVTGPNDAAQTVSNAQSDIIIHKVKTERINGGAWAVQDPR